MDEEDMEEEQERKKEKGNKREEKEDVLKIKKEMGDKRITIWSENEEEQNGIHFTAAESCPQVRLEDTALEINICSP
jgi:hypothetical protein